MSDDSIHQPHDGLFRKTWSNKEDATGFLVHHLPAPLVHSLDWQSLELQSGSYIDENLQRSSSDLLYKIKTADKEGYIYCLFEHWSTRHYWVALRLLKYQVRIWEQHGEQYPDAKKLPPIIPVVLAQDNKEWKVPRHFSELLDIPENIADEILDFVPQFTYRLIELAAIPYEEMQGTPTGIVSLRVLKAASFKELLSDPVWDEPLMEQIPDEMLTAILVYIQNALSKVDKPPFQDKIKELSSNRLRKIAMTLREAYIEDGIDKGMLIGKIHELQALLCQPETPKHDLIRLPDGELQLRRDQLEIEIRRKLGQ